jgi:hypothetical protein
MAEPTAKSNGRDLTLAALAEAKHLPPDFLRELGLHDLPQGGVGIAYFGSAGEEIAVKRRSAPKATEGSYWPKGKPLATYGQWRLDAAAKAGFLFLVEGESDCWALWHHGLPALGLPGADTAKTLQREHVEAVGAVYLHREPDAGGARFVGGVRRRLAELGFTGKVHELRMPGGVKDPADLHARDPEGFKAALEEAVHDSTLLEPEQPAGPGGEAGPGQSESVDGRPTITITTDEHLVNDEAVAALAGDPALYQRGGLLVRIVRDASPAAKGVRRPLAPRIDPLPPALLRERLAANARWLLLRRTKEGVAESPARPPGWCVAAVHARGDWPGLHHLEAVVEYPVLRPDGTLLSDPGYDRDTGLLLALRGPLPQIPERPTRDDALAARDELLEVVVDFPFAAPAHRAAWLAGLLTPLARYAYDGPAPLFLADGNAAGVGKGLLLDCAAEVLTGGRLTVATYTEDGDELRKRITALALAGERMVLLDNLAGRLGGPVLDAALTATSWTDRVLGVSRVASAPLYVTWYATGNNVALAGDTARRTCHIRLETPAERPEERADFRHRDLLAWVRGQRFRLLGAALTLLRAYCVAGRPDQRLKPWGSFDGWSALVRSAVVWAGLPDPGETRAILRQAADTDAGALAALLDALNQLDPDCHGLTCAEIVEQAKSPAAPPPEWHAGLRDAIEALAGRLDPQRLGYKLRGYRKRVVGGLYLDRAGTHAKTVRWAAYPASAFGRGDGGDEGDTSPQPPRRNDSAETGPGGEHPHHAHHPHHGEEGGGYLDGIDPFPDEGRP